MTEDESRMSTEQYMKSIKHSEMTDAANRGYELRRNKKIIISNIMNITIAFVCILMQEQRPCFQYHEHLIT